MPVPSDDDCSLTSGNSSAGPKIAGGSRKLVRSVLVFALAGTILYGAAVVISDYRVVAASLLAFPLADLFAVLSLVVVGWLIRGLRFH